jgi:ribosomal protein S18 acetylase RimI-like enzyme
METSEPRASDDGKGFTVRDGRPDDLAALVTLSRKTFTDKFGALYPPEDLTAFLDQYHSEGYYAAVLADPANLVRVAETDNRTLSAYLLCSPLSLPADNAREGALELKRIYVDTPVQGRELGSALVREAIAWAKARGAPELFLSVFSENDGARKLYERHGWKKVSEFIFEVGRTQDLEFLMRLDL